MNRKRSKGPSARVRTRIDVTTVRTKWATFAVAATPKGIASIFPIRGTAITAAKASRDPALGRRIRAGAELKFHPASGAHPASLSRATAALRAYASGRTRRLPSLDLVGTPFSSRSGSASAPSRRERPSPTASWRPRSGDRKPHAPWAPRSERIPFPSWCRATE